MKSSRTPKSIQRAQRNETRKERHGFKEEARAALKKIVPHDWEDNPFWNTRLKVRHERE